MSVDLDVSALTLGPSDDGLTINDVELVTSYNLEKDSATVSVPGLPAKFMHRTDNPLIKTDSGTRYLDHNAGRWPQSPWKPGIHAVLTTNPDFDFTGLDLITDRYALTKLLNFADGYKDDFEFGVQVVGGTVVFIRSDPATPQVITSFRGYRDDFGEKYLSYEDRFKKTLKHYRIITYKIGGVKIMLRYAADAYIPSQVGDVKESISISTTDRREDESSDLTINQAGILIPHSAILELNTCNKWQKNNPRLPSKFREAWISQAHHFALARYSTTKRVQNFLDSRAVFYPQDTTFYGKAGIVKEAGVDDKQLVRAFYGKLEGLLKQIRGAAVEGKGDQFLVTHQEGGKELVITPTTRVPVLSEQLCDRLKKIPADGVGNDGAPVGSDS